MTINMGPNFNAEQRTKLLRKRLQSNSSTSLIFCQELPGHFEKLVVKAVGYECVQNGSEAAVMWRNKSPNEVNDHKQSGGRNEITSKAFLSEKDLLSSISMVKLTTKKKPAISTLVVSYDGQLSGSNEENNYGIFLILVKFLNKVIEKNKIDSYIIGGDFRFNTLKFKPPSDVSVLSYETSKASSKHYRNYYFRHSRGEKCEHLIKVIDLGNQETPHNNQSAKKLSGRKDEEPNPSTGQSSTETNQSRIVSYWKYDDVSEIVLSFSQSNMDGKRLGSNACTIIAVLAAIHFLSDDEWFLKNSLGSRLDDRFVRYCHNLFAKGNKLYNSLCGKQTNNSFPEILENPNLNFKEKAEKGIEYSLGELNEFLEKLQDPKENLGLKKFKLAFGLIIPPDKSMTLLINERGESMLIDSHSHLETGAIVATASEDKLENMINYIRTMIQRDWKVTISDKNRFDVTAIKLK